MNRVLQIAQSEMGYTERSDGWTKFGQWYADNVAHHQSFAFADWCCMFVTWCMRSAGVLDTQWPATSPQGSEVNYCFNWLKNQGFAYGKDMLPEVSDDAVTVVFYCWDGDPSDLDHVGMVTGYYLDDPNTCLLEVIEGNKSGQVGTRTIALSNQQVATMVIVPTEFVKKNFPSLSFMLRQGDTGWAVEILQANLIALGFDIYGGVDGDFGKYTRDALKNYQKDAGIEVDGKAGTETFQSFLKE